MEHYYHKGWVITLTLHCSYLHIKVYPVMPMHFTQFTALASHLLVILSILHRLEQFFLPLRCLETSYCGLADSFGAGWRENTESIISGLGRGMCADYVCRPLKSGKQTPLRRGVQGRGFPFIIQFQDYSQYNHACILRSINKFGNQKKDDES